ncbi:efflux RND transporter periplasmic adaptor subunit [Xanthomonas oryzae]|uniref:Membrane fusion protein n=1 Tax=Xanthomonas oryzae pv. oryzicola (strain BLS256) TaxID=383407 RepID=G7TG72_XANOB|nr:efflux RND transporter periplasmic adaptor subunit [Xanthomonas oryzae]AEQ96627.1 membrane fusion protein [Xanthomonas oryzae pv. oryzicola BLS256]AKK64171.1 RND transporter [Xanthomonas oryzae pv. oryzicola]AKO00738.1 RND transporter [Xanthomonas oryzae pv. oryzicola]AKO19952.1 RND transporter [Xanthomonas oryzae pv. oryzicola]KOR41018.1 RND transporter [Xanthomonas oryzae]
MTIHRSDRFFSLCLVIPLALAACGKAASPAGSSVAPAVDIATAQARTVLQTTDLPGRVSPMRVAQVRARVAGIVLARRFEEGSDVKAGQVLFQIDPAPFEAAVARARGELTRSEAELENATAQFERSQQLVQRQVISRQDFDTARSNFKSTQAAVASARAALKTAQLDLGFATVRAPIDGRIGRALVTEGALVGQGGDATEMALVQQLDPIFADFNRPVAEALKLRGRARKGDAPLKVVIDIPELGQTREGDLLFADMRVDETTDTVSLRAQFDNRDNLLLPGMFVRVRTPNGTASDAVYVPQRAIQRRPGGNAAVMVVGADGKAELRDVRTGAMVGTDWQILDGLKAGERYVASGAARIQPGAVLNAAH